MPGTWSLIAMGPVKRKKSRSPHDAPDFLGDEDYASHPYGVLIEWDRIRRGVVDVDAPIHGTEPIQDEIRRGRKNGQKAG